MMRGVRAATSLLAIVVLPGLAFAQDAADVQDASPEASTEDGAAPAVLPDASALPSSPPPTTFGPVESFPLADGIQVIIQAPSDWKGEDGGITVPDLDQVDGELKVSRTWKPAGTESGRLFLVCASSTSKDWAHGIESLVFERLSGIANDELAKHMMVRSFESTPLVETAFGYQQDFHASGREGASLRHDGVRVLEAEDGTTRRPSRMSVVGRHSLAFSLKEEPPRALTCSLVCAEPADHAGAICGTVLATHRFTGETGPEPTPSLRTRFAVGFSRRPIAMGGVAAGLLSLLIGVVAVVRGLLLSPRA